MSSEPEPQQASAAAPQEQRTGDALPAPRGTGHGQAPAPTDGDNRYKAVQHKLKTLGGAMDASTGRLEALRRRMSTNADRASTLAGHIADAELDAVFVEMTNTVATALHGASVATGHLHESAQEVAADAEETQRTHSRLYEALDQVRTGRRERTPKPGFFAPR